LELWRSRVEYPGTALLGLLLIFSFVFNQSLPAKASTLGTNLSAGGVVPPTIDGVIGTDEWAFASRIDFTASLYSGTIYFMNDDTEMYLAIRLTRNGGSVPLNDLIIDITFDNTDAGTWHSGMDRIEYCGSGYCIPGTYALGTDWNLVSQGGDCCFAFPDTWLGGTNDVVAAATSNRTFDFVEFQHPLCSGDPNDFCLYPGTPVGFSLFIVYVGGDSGVFPLGNPPLWPHYHVGWNSCFHVWAPPSFHRRPALCLN
jgi:hypothetical protein